MKRSNLLLVSLVFLFPINLWASGYSDPVNIGPRAIGLGGAYVGIANDPSAVYHNPAAVSLLKGNQLAVGFDSNFVDFKFTPPGGATESSKKEFTPAPFFFYTHEIMENIAVGLGVYFPHGNVVKYPSASANILNPTEVNLYSMEITPTMSAGIPIIPGLSVGAGLRVVRISSSLKGQGFVLSQTPLFVDTLDSIDLSAWTVGAVFSGLYKPVDWISLGAVYRTKLTTGLEGDGKFAVSGKFSSTVTQVIPALFTTGVGIFPNKRLTIGLQYDFEQNSQNSQITLSSPNFPAPLVLPVGWKDSHTIHAGVSYNWLPEFYTSVGYARDFNASIPDFSSDRGNTDFDAHFVSAGAGVKIKKFDIAAAWKAFFGTNDVPNDGVNPIPGKYKIFTNTLSMDVAYRF
jgi:long-chain fatty acid transport protein